MNRLFSQRPDFKRLFCCCAATIFLLLCIACQILIVQTYRQSAQETQRARAQQCQAIALSLDNKLLELNRLADRLTFTTWVTKARSDSLLISEQLDYFEKKNSAAELAGYLAFQTLASNIAIYFPQKHTIVNQRRWWDELDFFYDMNIKDPQDKAKLLAHLAKAGGFCADTLSSLQLSGSQEDQLLLTQKLDLVQTPRAVFLVTIPLGRLGSFLKNEGGENLAGVSFVSEQQTLFSWRAQPSENDVLFEQPSIYGYTYEIYLRPQSVPFLRWIGLVILLAFSLCLLLSVICAYPLASLIYRPVKRILEHIEPEKTQRGVGEMLRIEMLLDNLSRRNNQLETEVTQYYLSARNGFMMHLLEGYFGAQEMEQQMTLFHLSCTQQQLVQVYLLLCETENPASSGMHLYLAEKEFLDRLPLRSELVVVDAATMALIVFPDEPEELSIFRQKLNEFCVQSVDAGLEALEGEQERGPLGISTSYQTAKQKALQQKVHPMHRHAVEYYYPTDWEVQLINHLKCGKSEPATAILKELQTENMRRALPPGVTAALIGVIYETLLRVVYELGWEAADLPTLPNASFSSDGAVEFQLLQQAILQVCGRVACAGQEHLGAEVLAYVQAHYNDFNLSLKELESVFKTSSSKIFRIFKETAGMPFYEYLSRIRIEKAKELLKAGCTVAQTAAQVGYENEVSFKRMFYRYEGIRPKAFVERVCAQNGQDA